MSEASVDIKFSSNGPDVFTALKASIDALNGSLNGLKESMDTFRTVMETSLEKGMAAAAAVLTSTKGPTDALKGSLEELKDAAKATDAPMDQLDDSLAAVAETEKKAAVETKKLGGYFDRLRTSFKDVGDSALKFNQMRQSVNDLRRSMTSFMAPALNFEDALASVKSIAGDDLTQAQLEGLGDKALDLGKKYGMAGADVLAAYEKMLATGGIEDTWGGAAQFEAIGEQLIRFSKANKISVDQASAAVTGALSNFGLGAEKAGYFMNVMTAAGDAGKANADVLVRSFEQLGGKAKFVGMTLEETTAIFETLAKGELKGEKAGTALDGVITGLKKAGYELSNGGFVKAIQDLKSQNLDAMSLNAMFDSNDKTVASLIENVDSIGKFNDKILDSEAVNKKLEIQMETTSEKIKRFNETINNTITGITKNFTGLALLTEGFGSLASGVVGAVQAYDAIKRITTAFTIAKAVEGEVTRKGMWATMGDMLIKTKAAIATKAMAVGNFFASASTWTLVGSLTALRVAIFNIPIVGWILAGVAALATMIYYFDELRYTLIGVWEVIKNIFNALFGMAELDIGGSFSAGYGGAEKKDQAEKDKEAKQQKLIDSMSNMGDNPDAVSGSSGAGGMMPTMPGLDRPMGSDTAGTSALGGGSIITSQPTQTTSNSQNVTIQAVNITVTTPKDLVDQIKNEVIKALTIGLSPTVAGAFNIK